MNSPVPFVRSGRQSFTNIAVNRTVFSPKSAIVKTLDTSGGLSQTVTSDFPLTWVRSRLRF